MHKFIKHKKYNINSFSVIIRNFLGMMANDAVLN